MGVESAKWGSEIGRWEMGDGRGESCWNMYRVGKRRKEGAGSGANNAAIMFSFHRPSQAAHARLQVVLSARARARARALLPPT